MSNKYLEKIAATVEHILTLQKDMRKPWTVIGQKEVARKHGYDVDISDMMALNSQAQNLNPKQTLINAAAIPAGASAAGALIGAGLGGSRGATLGILGGYLAGAIGGGIREGHRISETDMPEAIRRAVESRAWKRFDER